MVYCTYVPVLYVSPWLSLGLDNIHCLLSKVADEELLIP